MSTLVFWGDSVSASARQGLTRKRVPFGLSTAALLQIAPNLIQLCNDAGMIFVEDIDFLTWAKGILHWSLD